MSESVHYFAAMKASRKAERDAFGLPCPECKRLLPKASPTVLQPQGRCHRRGHDYRDPRPYPTNAEYDAIYQEPQS